MKNALLEDQDISPDIDGNILPQTEDQELDSPFIHLDAPLSMDDYIFNLDDGEGISDLFDAYDFPVVWKCKHYWRWMGTEGDELWKFITQFSAFMFSLNTCVFCWRSLKLIFTLNAQNKQL